MIVGDEYYFRAHVHVPIRRFYEIAFFVLVKQNDKTGDQVNIKMICNVSPMEQFIVSKILIESIF